MSLLLGLLSVAVAFGLEVKSFPLPGVHRRLSLVVASA